MTLNCSTVSLKLGNESSEVKELQQGLKKLGYYLKANGKTLVCDGKFGVYTESAVKAFQRATGHTVDGWFGPKTCASFNQKLGIPSTTSTTTNTTTTTTASKNTNSNTQNVVRTNPYKIDISKNILKEKDANFHIEGIHFQISSITFDTASNAGGWKSIELMDNHFRTFQEHDVARAYTVETNITLKEYKQLLGELEKLERQVCTVVCGYFKTGKFNVKITPALKNVNYMKLTLKLTEYY